MPRSFFQRRLCPSCRSPVKVTAMGGLKKAPGAPAAEGAPATPAGPTGSGLLPAPPVASVPLLSATRPKRTERGKGFLPPVFTFRGKMPLFFHGLTAPSPASAPSLLEKKNPSEAPGPAQGRGVAFGKVAAVALGCRCPLGGSPQVPPPVPPPEARLRPGHVGARPVAERRREGSCLCCLHLREAVSEGAQGMRREGGACPKVGYGRGGTTGCRDPPLPTSK